MATLLPEGKQSFTNSAGAPLVGGKVYTYDAGTSTPRATYQDAAGTTPNTNPVVLDARGEATIFWSGSYKIILKDALDVTIWTVDNVQGVDSIALSSTTSATGGAGLIGFAYALAYAAGTIGKWLQDLATSAGSTFIGWVQSGAGAVLRTISDKQRDQVSVFDFMTSAQIADIRSNTASLDVTTAIQAALDTSKDVLFPQGTYKTSAVYMNNQGQIIRGAGKYKTILKINAASLYGIASNAFGVRPDATAVTYRTGYEILDLTIDINSTANTATVAAIAIEDTWDVTLRNIYVNDSLNEASNRWGLWFGRALYTSATYSCTIGRVLHKGNAVSAPANFGTTVAHYSLSSWHTEHYYYQDMLYVAPTLQKDSDKFVLGAAAGPFVVVGGDYENGGVLFKTLVDGGAANIFGYGLAVSPMTGNLFGGVVQSATGSARPGASMFDFESQTRASRAIASASRVGTTVTVDLVLTTVNGMFKYMAPEVGELITVAGTGTAMDGSAFVVTSRTETYPTVNRITYSTVTSGALGPITTGTVTPDAAVGYRYSRMFGNKLGWDPLAARLLVAQRMVFNNQAYVTGFKPDGTTEVQLIGVDSSGRMALGSINQFIEDTGNFRVTTAGKGFTVTSPDGLTTKTITINNAGVLTLI